jgi:adenine-specific DNA-methyltransferase
MDKLKMQTPDLTQDNIAKIRDMFPGCVTVAADENGSTRLTVDFDLLRQELSDHVVDGVQERYRLEWPGKREALALANASIAKTLRPSLAESVNFEETRHLIIEGDNLEALKILQETYLGSIKLIYIDPPYNTGSDLIYNDDFVDPSQSFLVRSNQVNDGGDRLVANPESNGRFHSDWLSMIYPRLKLARNFLHSTGVICVSIDEGEVSNLKQVMTEIFGERNFLGVIANVNNPKGRSDDRFIATSHEYLMVYARDIDTARVHGFEPEDHITRRYTKSDANGKIFRDMDLRKTGDADLRRDRPDMFYYFYFNEDSGLLEVSKNPKEMKGWHEIVPLREDGAEGRWRWGFDTARSRLSDVYARHMPNRGIWGIFERDYLDGRPPVKSTSTWTFKDVNSERGSEEFISLGFDKEVFSRPKPVGTMHRVLNFGTCPDENAVVMDFFGGSGTFSQAVLELNSSGSRKLRYILVQWPETTPKGSVAERAGFKNIVEITKERIRRVGKKILDGTVHPNWNRDIGFRTLKIDTSNMQDVFYRPDELSQGDLLTSVDNVKPDRTAEDLLFQVMVDWGVDITLPINRKTIQGKSVLFVDGNALVACFDAGISEDLVKELAGREPLRVVFRDNGFASDAVKINVEQIFRQLSPGTDVKSI